MRQNKNTRVAHAYTQHRKPSIFPQLYIYSEAWTTILFKYNIMERYMRLFSSLLLLLLLSTASGNINYQLYIYYYYCLGADLIFSFVINVWWKWEEMGTIRGAEGRMCESKSSRFKGPCSRDSNCASVCKAEGFPSGDCRGFRRRCFCTKPC